MRHFLIVLDDAEIDLDDLATSLQGNSKAKGNVSNSSTSFNDCARAKKSSSWTRIV